MAEIKTQGTELYLLDTDNSVVLKIANVASFEGLGGSASDIDVTNFDDTLSRRFLVGLQDNGSATFNVMFDPNDSSHARMAAIAGGGLYKWAVGLSDGFAQSPSYDAGPPADFDLPTGRTWFTFDASLQQWQRSAAIDDVWRISASLRISGDISQF